MGDDTTYTEAVYFIYVTISTIGFGDFVIRFEDQNDYNRVVSSNVDRTKQQMLTKWPKRPENTF